MINQIPHKDKLDAAFLIPGRKVLSDDKQNLISVIGNRTGVPEPKRCYNFDTVDDVVAYGNPYIFQKGDGISDNPVTIEFETENCQVSDSNISSSVQRNWQLDYKTDTNKVRFILWNGGTGSGHTIFETNNTFTGFVHIALTYTGSISGGVKIYVNGVDEAYTQTDFNGGYTYNGQASGYHLTLNQLNDSIFRGGKVSRLRLFDNVVSEPTKLYYNFSLPSLVFAKCDELNGAISYDSSGNGNHGTISNIDGATFFYEGIDVPFSFQNEVGFRDWAFFNDTFVRLADADRMLLAKGTDFKAKIKFVIGRPPTADVQYLFASTPDSSTDRIAAYMRIESTSLDVSIKVVHSNGSTNDYELTTNVFLRDNIDEWAEIERELVVTNNGGVYSATLDGVALTSTSGLATPASTQRFYIGVSTGGSVGEALEDSEIKSLVITDLSDNVVKKYLASEGWAIDVLTNNVTYPLPRNESNINFSVHSTSLTFKGKIHQLAKIANVNVGSFDGLASYVDVGNSLDYAFSDGSNDEPFTLLAFVNQNSINPNAAGIICRGSTNAGSNEDYRLQIDGSGHVIFLIYDASSTQRVDSNVTLTESTDYLIAGSYDGNQLNPKLEIWIYQRNQSDWFLVENKSDKTVNGSFNSLSGSSLFYLSIGRIDLATDRVLDGNLWDAQIHNKALENSDFDEVIRGNILNSVIGHWPFNEGVGNTIFDLSGNGNHGTWQNVTNPNQWGKSDVAVDYRLIYGFNYKKFSETEDFTVDKLVSGDGATTSDTFGRWSSNVAENRLYYDTANNRLQIEKANASNPRLVCVIDTSDGYRIGHKYRVTVKQDLGQFTGSGYAIIVKGVSTGFQSVGTPAEFTFEFIYDYDISGNTRLELIFTGTTGPISGYYEDVKIEDITYIPADISNKGLDAYGDTLQYKGLLNEAKLPFIDSQIDFQYYKGLSDQSPPDYQIGDTLTPLIVTKYKSDKEFIFNYFESFSNNGIGTTVGSALQSKEADGFFRVTDNGSDSNIIINALGNEFPNNADFVGKKVRLLFTYRTSGGSTARVDLNGYTEGKDFIYRLYDERGKVLRDEVKTTVTSDRLLDFNSNGRAIDTIFTMELIFLEKWENATRITVFPSGTLQLGNYAEVKDVNVTVYQSPLQNLLIGKDNLLKFPRVKSFNKISANIG